MRRRFLNNIKSISSGNHSEYFTIEALENGLTAKLSKNACEYRIDDGNWNTLSANTNTPSINKGQTLSFKGNLTPDSGIGTFTISNKCNIKGNIMSMLYGDDFIGQNDLSGKTGAFYWLFGNCTNIVDASKLILPATTLARDCYSSMFSSCTSLTTAPELPATTLASSCYSDMFYGCKSLTTAPELPATTLAYDCYYCYYSMFQSCTSLTTAPELPATTLASSCYKCMFSGCSLLVTAPELPATTLADYCYDSMFKGCTSLTTAPELPATKLANYCYHEMFYGCKSLTTAPHVLPATKLANYCYDSMFRECTSLTTAPELPATKLANYCYSSMFRECTSLTTAPELPATKLADSCYSFMFYGTNVLPDCSNIDFTNEAVVASRGLGGLFAGTKVTDADLERILPKNSEGKYCLPVTTLASDCYSNMFSSCTSLTTAPELPATTSAYKCYYYMFSSCTSLTTAHELPATTLADYCYDSMFYGCTSLTTAPELPATKLASYCYHSMFYGCTSLTTAPELPATTLANSCYSSMFLKCTSLTTAPELPATYLANNCYSNMFHGCTSLTTAPHVLPANAATSQCYSYMFYGCTSLTTAPELLAWWASEYSCYGNMFQGCTNLNYIKMLATNISTSTYSLSNWVKGVSSTGTFVKHPNMTSLPTGYSGIPNGWTVVNDFTRTECTSLTITADNVKGNDITTTIYYTAICNGIDYKGNTVTGVVEEGTVISSEFPQNTSETDTVERTITFEFLGVTASTVITQGVWLNQSYTVDLNNQWQLSTSISNPDSTTYDGVYQSFSNKGVNNSAALMYIDIKGYTSFKFYVRSYAESNYDFVVVSNLDSTLTNETTSGTNVKLTTKGKQNSGTGIDSYQLVEFTGIDSGEHRITVMYRKDSSSASGDDRGYVLIPKNQ